MLFGYERERAHLGELVSSAEAGHGGAVVLSGEPGSGKSSLSDEVAERVAGSSVLLRARGVEQESPIAFAGLHQLLTPLRDQVAGLPTPQAEALQAALALAPAPAGDQLALGAAVHSLMTSAGTPVVAVVDDAQWLDRSSLSALVFAARRLSGTSVTMLFAERDGDAAIPLHGLPRILLPGLDRRAARRLLAAAGASVDPDVADLLCEGTGGNPLALTEAARTLPAAALAGIEPLPHPLPVGPALQDHFGARIALLPQPGRQALVLVAAGHGDTDVLDQALHAAGLSWTDLDDAESDGLVGIGGGQVGFRHPLMRAAAYHAEPPRVRRRAHGLLAAAESDLDRRAWHAAWAVRGPDDEAASGMRETAGRAFARGGYPEAAAALQAAAGLTADRGDRLGIRIETARAWHHGGLPDRALAVLDAATADCDSPVAHASLQETRGAIELWLGNPRAARDLLRDEADHVQAADPIVAARLRLLASMPSTMIAEVEPAHDLVRAAWAVLSDGPLAPMAAAALGATKLLIGEYEDGRALVQQAAEAFSVLPPDPQVLPATFFCVQGLWLAQSWEQCEELLRRVIDHGRRHRAPGLTILPLALLAEVHLALGRVQEARAEASEAVELCDALGHLTERCHALAILAKVEATLGDPVAQAQAQEVLALTRETGAVSMEAFAHQAMGLLALAEGRHDDAVTALEQAHQVTAASGVVHPGVAPLAALAEALARTGRMDDAEQIADELGRQAEAIGTSWAHGVALRCRGLLGGAAAEGALRRSLEILPPEQSPFEAARTELALGEVLRRDRRRREARQYLASAAETFTRLGAEPWAERARAELRAAGGQTAPTVRSTLPTLSPQELRIALRVAAGETNREVAAALYLSPKTVENTLTTVYSKVGVRSRTELTGTMLSGG